MNDDGGDRSWIEYRRLILSELQRLDKQINDLKKDTKDEEDDIETKLAKLMVRVDELERKNTYRGGMLGAAVAFGGIVGWLLTGGGAIISLWDKVRGVAQ